MQSLVSKCAAVLVVLGLGACAVADPDTDPQVPLGDFSLGHNVVVTKNARKIGPSRTASADEWETILEAAMEKRFGRYEGEKLYHIGINLDGYALAIPGIPVVLAPKSILAIKVNVWDDAAQKKLTEKPRTLTVFEQLDGGTILGSGLSRSREEQMSNLAANMARAVERFLVANAEWFGETASEEAKEAAEADILKIPETAPEGTDVATSDTATN